MLASTSILSAQSNTRDRVHSVNKAIQKVTQTKAKEQSVVEELHSVVKSGKVSGQFRTLYSTYKNTNAPDTYATAVGGMLKYETAQYHGWSLAAAMITTNDIRTLSGEGQKHNSELSGERRSYTEVSEAYIDYQYKTLQLRAGRQIFDTPLADSDDTFMVMNSFEAYTAFYTQKEWSVMLGHFDRWQGVDADLDKGWIKTGKNGVSFAGLTYTNKFLDLNAWYYDFSNPSDEDLLNGDLALANRSLYTDISAHLYFKKDFFLHLNGQYLLQKSYDNSDVAANIYGLMGEVVYNKLGVRLAYNKAQKESGKESFVGYGGGGLYTSMDSVTLDVITQDRSAYAAVGILSYHYKRMKFLYAYGLFKGSANSQGVEAKIVEQNFGVKYEYNKALTVAAIYALDRDRENPASLDYNDDNLRLFLAYNF